MNFGCIIGGVTKLKRIFSGGISIIVKDRVAQKVEYKMPGVCGCCFVNYKKGLVKKG
jgi:hypothetical protein